MCRRDRFGNCEGLLESDDDEYTNERVTKQPLANLSDTYQFNYTVDASGNITQTLHR
jgi:hypothetical protein